MATQAADAELIHSSMMLEPAVHPRAATRRNPTEYNKHTVAARGIIVGVLIAAPFWALIVFTIARLL